MNISAKFHRHPFMASEEKSFEYMFFLCAKLAFRLPWQPIKFSDLDKIHMVARELLKKHFCKTFVKISAVQPISTFFHYKSIETICCHCNQSSYPIGTKTQLFVPPPIDAICEIW